MATSGGQSSVEASSWWIENDLHYGDMPQEYHKFQAVGHIFGNVTYVIVKDHSIAHILGSNFVLWALSSKGMGMGITIFGTPSKKEKM